jgi:hypothetical protein
LLAVTQAQNPHVPYTSATLSQQQHTGEAFAPDMWPVPAYLLNILQNPTSPPKYTSCLPPGAAPPLVQPVIAEHETSPTAHVSQQPPPQPIYHQAPVEQIKRQIHCSPNNQPNISDKLRTCGSKNTANQSLCNSQSSTFPRKLIIRYLWHTFPNTSMLRPRSLSTLSQLYRHFSMCRAPSTLDCLGLSFWMLTLY